MFLSSLRKRLSKKPFHKRRKRKLHRTHQRVAAESTSAASLLEQEGPLEEPVVTNEQEPIPLVNDEEQHLEMEKNESTIPSNFL